MILSKKLTVIFFALVLTYNLHSQVNSDTVSNKEKSETLYSNFDFWLGDWNVSWTESNGKMGKGRNSIAKILDGNALEENFLVTEGAGIGFAGKSISYMDKSSGIWKQLWVDNRGVMYEFEGDFEDGLPKFKTKAIQRNGVTTFYRMIFRNISKDKLVWDWEKSVDDRQSWQLMWCINYDRIED